MIQYLIGVTRKENKEHIKKMFLNSLPLAFAGLLSVLIGFIDSLYLSNYSLEAFKALSLIIPILGIVGSMGIAIGAALVNSMANYEGKGEKQRVYFSTIFLILISYIIIVIFTIFGYDRFINFNNLQDHSNAKILVFFTQYWFAIVPLYLFVLVLNVVTQYLSYRNKNKEIIYILSIIVISNLILNPIFIFYLDLGVIGAALASIVSLTLGNLYFALRQKRLQKFLSLVVKPKDYLKKMGTILKVQSKVAFSVFLAIAIFALGSIFFNQLAIKQGNEFLAVIGLIEQLKLLMIFPTRGVTGAFLIMFEKAISLRQVNTYWKLYWSATTIIAAICIFEALLIFFFSDLLFRLFNIESESMIKIMEVLLISLYFYFLVNILPRASQVGFITLGKSYLLFLQSLFSVLFGYILTYLLVGNIGKEWFIHGQSLGVFIATTIFLLIFRSMLKKRIKADKKML
ncbi:MATE family efflux transporter [Flavivirga jejuensis]|uniref:MATE family efflux transporter n=1 Tax=Flavivirga jejuensis TaxID=870487 RepID=A0ABT8WTC5_9FLAO|nr:MATE family efflux transporter [Flavivirga jejuensis]MDO5976349.1 MATE family efflux transporter [Flavivirga jejuensis]